MPTIEQDNTHLERLERSHGLAHEADRAHRLMGPMQQLPQGLTDPQLDEQAAVLLFRQINGHPVDLQTLMRNQAIQYRMMSIQNLNARTNGLPAQRAQYHAEHVLANQGVAMSLYLSAAMQQVNSSTTNALNLWRTTVPSLPPNERQILSVEQERTRVYTQRLNTVGSDHLHFSNYRAIQIAYIELGRLIGGPGVPRQLPSLAQWRNSPARAAKEWTELVQNNDQVRRLVEANNLVATFPDLVARLEALEKVIRDERARQEKLMTAESAVLTRTGTQGPLNVLALNAVDVPRKIAYLRGVETFLVNEDEHVTKLLADLPGNEAASMVRSTLTAQKEQIVRRLARVRELLRMNMPQMTQFNAFDFHEHFLKQQFVNLLSGHAEKDGATACAWPQLLEIQTLQFRATQILRLQEAIARDERIPPTQKSLRQQELTKQRTEVMARLTSLTDELGRYHIDMLRISSIQEQFGEYLPLQGARQPRRGAAIEERIRQQFEKFHDDERKFHSGRVLAMVNMAKEQFNPNSLTVVADAAQLGFVQALDRASEIVGGAVDWIINSRVIPTQALRDRLRSTMNLSLKDVLQNEVDAKLIQRGTQLGGSALTRERIATIEREGKPPNAPEDKKKLWNELNALRRPVLAEMMVSIRTPMQEFHNAPEIPRIEETLQALQEMPSASEFADGQEVSDADLRAAGLLGPDGRVTRAHVTALKAKPTGALKRGQGATLYRKLLEQLHANWGTLGQGNAEGTGFIGKYQKMLKAFDAITGDRLNLIAACFAIADSYNAIGWSMVAAGGALLTAPIFIAAGGAILGFGARTALSAAWRVGTAPFRAGAQWMRGTFSGASWAGRVLGGAALVYQGWRTYEHFGEINERNANAERERDAFIDALYLSGFQGYYFEGGEHKWTDSSTPGDVKYRKPTVFYYNSNPATPWRDGTAPPEGDSVPRIQADQIMEMAVGTGSRVLRHGGDAVELAAIAAGLRLAPRLGGRVIPYVGAVILAVEGINAFNDNNQILSFLRNCKPSVLAHINPMATFKLSHYELLELFSRDAFTSLAERDSVREKLLFSMFYQEISKFPQMMQAVFPNGGHLSELDSYFEASNGGFKDIVLPLIQLRLNRRLGEDNVSWDMMKKSRINGFHILQFLSSPVGRVEIQAAIREAMILAAEDRKERNFRDLTALLARLEARQPNQRHPRHDEMLRLVRNLLQSAGEKTVFGQRLSAANLAGVPEGKTRTKLIIEQLFSRLNGNARASHNVTPAQVSGLPGNLNLDDPMSIYMLITDPVLRDELRIASHYRTVAEIGFRLSGRRNAVEDNGPDIPQYDGYQVPLDVGIEGNDAPLLERIRPRIQKVVQALQARAVEYEGEALKPEDLTAHTRPRSSGEAQQMLSNYGLRLMATYRLQAERTAQANNRSLHRSHFRYHVPGNDPTIRDWPRANGMGRLRIFGSNRDNQGNGSWQEPNWNSLRTTHPELTKERVLAIFGEMQVVDGKNFHATTIIFGDPNGQNIQVLQSTGYYGENPRIDGWETISSGEQFIARQPHGRIMIDLATKREHEPPLNGGALPGAEIARGPQNGPQQRPVPALAQLPADINAPQPLGPRPDAPAIAVAQVPEAVRGQAGMFNLNGVGVRALPERLGDRTRVQYVTDIDDAFRRCFTALTNPTAANTLTVLNRMDREGRPIGVVRYMLAEGNSWHFQRYSPTDDSSEGMILRTDPMQRRYTPRGRAATEYMTPGMGDSVRHITSAELTALRDGQVVQGGGDVRTRFTFYYWDAARDRAFLTRPPYRLQGDAPHSMGPLLPWNIAHIRDLRAERLYGAPVTQAQRDIFMAALTTPFNRQQSSFLNDQSLKDVLNLCDATVRLQGQSRTLSTQDVFNCIAPMYRELARTNSSEGRQQQSQFLRHLVQTLLSTEVNGTLRGAPPTAAQIADGFEPAQNNTVQLVISRMRAWYVERKGTAPPAPLDGLIMGL